MRQFLFTSPRFDGQIILGYDENGVLVKFVNEATLTSEQLEYFRTNFPFKYENMELLKGKSGIITEITDLSFDRFWADYDCKKGKINAEKEWKKLSDGERMKAIMAIRRYKASCKNKNIEQVYPERYLKHRRYEDE